MPFLFVSLCQHIYRQAVSQNKLIKMSSKFMSMEIPNYNSVTFLRNPSDMSRIKYTITDK